MMDFPNGSPFDDSEHWYWGRTLPHYDGAQIYQCITYRLADSIPQQLLRETLSSRNKAVSRIKIEEILDRGLGSCILQSPEVAQIVLDNWFHFHNERYQIISYVIMPNHCHILIHVFKDFDLAKIVQSWKTFTAKEIHKLYPEEDKHIWQFDYWDRFIRNEKHYLDCIHYIHQNPVKAGLCRDAKEWLFSSAILSP